ncbi:MAG TPA: helix-turn-helix transcriptional regulator [Chitinophagaceae bacterium]|jgi:transcriptional regulator GlxA family with amidase domain
MSTNNLSLALAQVDTWSALGKRVNYRASDLALLFNLQPRTVLRVFRRELRTSPQKWLNELRQLEIARLAHANMPGKQIVFEVGYSQLSYFSRTFKQYYGIPFWKYKEQVTVRKR